MERIPLNLSLELVKASLCAADLEVRISGGGDGDVLVVISPRFA